MSVLPFVQAIIFNSIDNVERFINEYERQQNTKAFPNGLNTLATYTFHGDLIYQTDYPLHIAARFGHINIIRLLVNQGAPINQHNKMGQTPLIVALTTYNSNNNTTNITNTIETLLDLGSSLEGDTFNRTPLHWATLHSLEPVIKLLIEKDRTILTSMTIDNQYTPVDLVMQCQCTKSIMNIYYHTCPDMVIANIRLLHKGVQNRKTDMIKHLFWLGMPVSYLERNKNGRTLFRTVLNLKSYEMIILLLDLGVDTDSNTRQRYNLHTEDEVAAIRYDCFFSRSLVSRLLPFCMEY
jgi:ankyrin repeat protein